MTSPRNDTKRVRAVETGAANATWRRLHPITPLAKTWSFFVAIIGIFSIRNWEALSDLYHALPWISGITWDEFIAKAGWIIIGFVVIILVVAAYSWLAWRHMTYAITPEAVYYREGILSRKQRHARLSRIQGVSISQPLLGRLVGLGSIDIEVAGGSDSSLTFGYLPLTELERVRAEVYGLMREKRDSREADSAEPGRHAVAQTHPGAGTSTGVDGGAPRAEAGRGTVIASEHDIPVLRVPTGRLAASLVVNIGMIVAAVVALVFLVGTVVLVVIYPSAIVSFIPLVITGVSLIGALWSRFSTNFDFCAAITREGIRVRAGLMSTRAQTIAPQRIHGVRISQPFFWRFFDWYKVEIAQAGFVGKDDANNASVLLPVGTRDDMLRALWLVLPDLGTDEPVTTLIAGITGYNDDNDLHGFIPNPPRTRVFDWLAWKRHAVLLNDRALFIRSGRICRTLSIIPHGRVQSLSVMRGPIDRWLDLATVHLHLVTSSGVSTMASHLDRRVAADIAADLRARLGDKAVREDLGSWAHRVSATASAPGDALFDDNPRTTGEEDAR